MKNQLLDIFGVYSLSLVAKLAQRLPKKFAFALGWFGGNFCYFLSRRRHFAYADLKAAFGDTYNARQIKQIVRRHYCYIGESAIEFLRFPILTREAIDSNIEIVNIEAYHNAIKRNKGLVLLTGHVGNWELIQIVSSILGHPVYALMREQKYPRLNKMLNDFRRSRGSGVVSTGMGVRELLRALRNQELVGVLGDQSAGKQQGIIVPLFGRKTTIPTGAFEIAARQGTPVLPAFIIRKELDKHKIIVHDPIVLPEGAQKGYDFEKQVREYVAMLEDLIRENPSQWLWAKKRWKYTWTKRILILLDGKPGHVKQSHAIAQAFEQVKEQYGRDGVEFTTQTVNVHYRSKLARKIFMFLALFFLPKAQGRLGFLKLFFEPETQSVIEKASVDFVISAGSSLVPLNLCIANECRAKSIVCMKPPFPYNHFKYDMAVVPMHDRGHIPAEAVRTYLTPSLSAVSPATVLQSLRENMPAPDKVRVALFLGGPTGRYRLDVSVVEKVMNILQRTSVASGDFILTTSRRTPEAVETFLKRNQFRYAACQLAVLASEDNRAGVIEAMFEMADILIVTEDSLSMISESVAAGKKVIVLSVDFASHLSVKHKSFTEHLVNRNAVIYLAVNQLEEALLSLPDNAACDFLKEEEAKIQKRLQEIL